MTSLITVLIVVSVTDFSFGQDRSPGKDSLGFTLSLPYLNNYYYYDHDLKRSNNISGFVGAGAAVFYTKNEHKLSLQLGLSTSLPAPIGPLDFAQEGTRTSISAACLEGLYHKKLPGPLRLIAGLNVTDYYFNFISYVDSLPGYFKHDITIGITTGISCYLSRHLALAVYYRPAAYSFTARQYKHLISGGLWFDIPDSR